MPIDDSERVVNLRAAARWRVARQLVDGLGLPVSPFEHEGKVVARQRVPRRELDDPAEALHRFAHVLLGLRQAKRECASGSVGRLGTSARPAPPPRVPDRPSPASESGCFQPSGRQGVRRPRGGTRRWPRRAPPCDPALHRDGSERRRRSARALPPPTASDSAAEWLPSPSATARAWRSRGELRAGASAEVEMRRKPSHCAASGH